MNAVADNHGLLASFASARELEYAVVRVRESGFEMVDAYTPYPVPAVSRALGVRGNPVGVVSLLCGMVAGAGTWFMQWYASVISYPFLVGGKPFNSWPAFIIPTFEMTVLAALIGALLAMLVANRLPKPYHPVFNVEEFERAGIDRFFLLIGADDKEFDRDKTRRLLESLNPQAVYNVPL